MADRIKVSALNESEKKAARDGDGAYNLRLPQTVDDHFVAIRKGEVVLASADLSWSSTNKTVAALLAMPGNAERIKQLAELVEAAEKWRELVEEQKRLYGHLFSEH